MAVTWLGGLRVQEPERKVYQVRQGSVGVRIHVSSHNALAVEVLARVSLQIHETQPGSSSAVLNLWVMTPLGVK